MKTETLLSNTRRDPVTIPPGINWDQLIRPPSSRCAVHHQMREEPTTSRIGPAKGLPGVQWSALRPRPALPVVPWFPRPGPGSASEGGVETTVTTPRCT
jgi:hypothetical protein